MSSEIHPTAIIDPTARLGVNVSVGPYTVIGPDCVLGDNCEIGSSVAIHKWTELGQGVKVWHGASLGGDPQDLKYKGAKTRALIGDNTVVRECVTVNRSTGEGHDTIVGTNCFLANSVNLAGHVTIEDFAIIGGLTPIHQFVRVGCHCMIGGSSAVQKDVIPYTKAFGIPLKMYGLNSVGLSRRGFTEQQRDAIGKAYRILFRSGLNTTQALARLKGELDLTPEIRHIVEFVESSERGITK
jgi:UDP-N-acetylglucosamine acyltransferase